MSGREALTKESEALLVDLRDRITTAAREGWPTALKTREGTIEEARDRLAAIEAAAAREALPSVEEMARALHDRYAPRQGHDHHPSTCASLTPGGLDWEDAEAILAAIRAQRGGEATE